MKLVYNYRNDCYESTREWCRLWEYWDIKWWRDLHKRADQLKNLYIKVIANRILFTLIAQLP